MRYIPGDPPGPLDAVVIFVGVGQYPYSFTLVKRPGIERVEHSPFRIVPQRGQVPENNVKPPRSECWAVFHKRESGSYFPNDPRHVRPHTGAITGNSRSFARCADILAREASRYHVNNSAPWSSVKGLNVVPNRERRENTFILPEGKYSCGVGHPLDGANGSPSKKVSAKYPSTNAREKCQLIHIEKGAAPCSHLGGLSPLR